MADFMSEAVREAEKGVRLNHGGPFGAVIVRKGRIVGRGHNNVVRTNDPTAHAEMVAIRDAAKRLKNFDLSDCEIYTSCEPCPMCLGAILWARLKKMYYGCTMEDAARIGFDDSVFYDIINRKGKGGPIKKNIGRAECLKAFALWMNKKHKVRY
jgi:guanine deaminase